MQTIGLVMCLLVVVQFWFDIFRPEPPFQQLSITSGRMSEIGGCEMLRSGSSQYFHVKVGAELKVFNLGYCIDGLGGAIGRDVEIRSDKYSTPFGVDEKVRDIRTSEKIYLNYDNPFKHSTTSKALRLMFIMLLSAITFWLLLNIYRNIND